MPYSLGLRRSIKIVPFIKEFIMNLSAPKKVTWVIAVVIGALGVLGNFVQIPVISDLSFVLVLIGFVLLAIATLLNGL